MTSRKRATEPEDAGSVEPERPKNALTKAEDAGKVEFRSDPEMPANEWTVDGERPRTDDDVHIPFSEEAVTAAVKAGAKQIVTAYGQTTKALADLIGHHPTEV